MQVAIVDVRENNGSHRVVELTREPYTADAAVPADVWAEVATKRVTITNRAGLVVGRGYELFDGETITVQEYLPPTAKAQRSAEPVVMLNCGMRVSQHELQILRSKKGGRSVSVYEMPREIAEAILKQSSGQSCG